MLVVEDEALVRMIAVDSFEDLGFRVLEASCGEEALQVIRTCEELWGVCTDIEMPGEIDGVALAHLLRMQFPSARIVICSGRKLPSKTDLPARARFLAKPYSLDDLRFIVDDAED
jgi:two-component system, response regulator PdtaR